MKKSTIEDKKVFVGIPAFENHETISRTIESLRLQTFQDWICFIADDSDSDLTKIASFKAIGNDLRFHYIKNENRLGQVANCQKLLGICDLPFFKILCADDTIYPNCLENSLNVIDSDSNVVLVTGLRDVVDINDRILFTRIGYSGKKCILSRDDLVRNLLLSGSNRFGEFSFSLFRTESLKLIGGFRKENEFLLDISTYIDVTRVGSAASLPTVFGAYRIWSNSVSGSSTKADRKEELHYPLLILSESYGKNKYLLIAYVRIVFWLKSKLRRLIYLIYS